jgi:hypothetical protein
MATSKKQTAKPSTPILDRWLITASSKVGRHPLHIMTEVAGTRPAAVQELRKILQSHYVAPEIATKRLADLGAPKTAQILRQHLPTTKIQRSGDLGEVLATEIAEHVLKYNIPIRRLRWKDGREMALRGDDLVGIRAGANGSLEFLKGESKSRTVLATSVLDEAGSALDRDHGRPSRHSVIFVAERLREREEHILAVQLEEAALQSFTRRPIQHLLFILTGGPPKNLLTSHLSSCAGNRRIRNAVAVQIADHASFIRVLYGGI